jgi:hypothetical protein
MAVSLTAFLAYARLEPDDTDQMAVLCLDAAMRHAEDVTGRVPKTEDDAKLELYVYAIAAHYYDARSFAADSFSRALANQMRLELKYNRGAVGDG